MLCFLAVALSALQLASSSAAITAKGELLAQGFDDSDTSVSTSSRSEAGPNEAVRQAVNGSTPTGWVQIGSPAKWLYVILDTGSDKLVAKTWDTVANELESIDQGENGMIMPSSRLYDHSNSSSYHRRYMMNPDTHKMVPDQSAITYGSGTAITDVGSDIILVGRRSLDNFTLMEITRDSLDLLHTSKGIAGILGLQHMKNKSLGRSLFSRLREEGKMTSFGYCRGSGNNGTFIWGDNSTEGQELHVVGDMHWAVKLGNVNLADNKSHELIEMHSDHKGKLSRGKHTEPDVDEEDYDSADTGMDDEVSEEDANDILAKSCTDNSCCGILDTGSNIIAGPRNVMAAIAQKIKVKSDCSNFDELPPITMTFGGMPVEIQPKGYVMKIQRPPGGFQDEAEQDTASSGDSTDSEASLRTIKAHGDTAEAGLAQREVSKLSAGARRWKAAFERLYRDNGVDFRDMLDDILMDLKNETKDGPEFLCMPALVPIDKKTEFGPLYIVGTPLLETYYARWSFGQNATAPRIHLKPVKEADACKAPGDELLDTASNSLVRKEKMSGKVSGRSSEGGIIEREIEDIAFPHWAKSLLTV
jgi:hypothetical protein